MEIRKTRIEELDEVMKIYDIGRELMRKTGNFGQWIDGYPSRELVTQDINEGNSFVCTEDDEILGVFYYIQGDEPTYQKIYQGEWLNDYPYGVIHRIASSGKKKGIGKFCIDWCLERCPNLKIDTHKDNVIMHDMLQKNGLTKCGIIYVNDGSERVAYQKTLNV